MDNMTIGQNLERVKDGKKLFDSTQVNE